MVTVVLVEVDLLGLVVVCDTVTWWYLRLGLFCLVGCVLLLDVGLIV